MKATLAGYVKGSEDVVLPGKSLCLVSSNVAVRCTYGLFPMRKAKPSCRSFKKRSSPTVSSIPIAGAGTMSWSCRGSNTPELIIQSCLPGRKIIVWRRVMDPLIPQRRKVMVMIDVSNTSKSVSLSRHSSGE